VSGSVFRVCSRARFIGRRKEGSGVQTWARVRVSERVPVATVVLEGHGRVRRCGGDVGDSVAQQGDEGGSGEQWEREGGPDGFLPVFHVSRSRFGQGRQGTDRGEAGALLGGQGLGLGLPTTVANSCFDFA
jgi:hypothetical protein